jgi:hypothetical protein
LLSVPASDWRILLPGREINPSPGKRWPAGTIGSRASSTV